MTLVLQTTVPGQVSVWLVKGRKIIVAKHLKVEWHGSDRALAFVDQTLREKKKTLLDISSIIVVRGPGSFTAVRTGLIIANTLAEVLRIPAHGVVAKKEMSDTDVIRHAALPGKKNILIRPWYGKSPNITRPKIKRPQARAKR